MMNTQHSRQRYQDHLCRVTRSTAAFILAFVHIAITIIMLITLKFIYDDVVKLDKRMKMDSLKIIFWCLLASCFYTIFGAFGWAYGVHKRKLIFFWPWLILTIPTYSLLWVLLMLIHCSANQVYFMLLLPQVFLQVLPLYFASQYYDYKVFERAESVL